MSHRVRQHGVRGALLVLLVACGGGSPTDTATSGSSGNGGNTGTGGTGGTPAPVVYVPGQSYFGRKNYIEFVAGNAPVILSAPHGGALVPSSIPDRTAAKCGGSATTVTDNNTIELVRAMQQRYFARFGRYPYVVISHLSRKKLDPNRMQLEAACNVAEAQDALDDWHGFISLAKAEVTKAFGTGWYMDMHGHAHPIARLELGYLLADTDVNRTDAQLDASPVFAQTSSIRTLVPKSGLRFSQLLRGPQSLGSLFVAAGFPAVPSQSDPAPNGTDYFNGGDNTERHTCGSAASALGGVTDGPICGVQIETNYTGVRDTQTSRDRFGDVTAQVLETYLLTHWGLKLRTP